MSLQKMSPQTPSRQLPGAREISRPAPRAGFLLGILICATAILSGCALPELRLPRVHKLSVQQGNVITQAMVDKLRPGMTRSQVAYIMGEPVFRNSFNDNRWDYIYTLELPGIFDDDRRISIYFDNEQLAFFTGDYVPTAVQEETAIAEAGNTPEGDADTD
jgi:outer membrane protein assembly factor BamE